MKRSGKQSGKTDVEQDGQDRHPDHVFEVVLELPPEKPELHFQLCFCHTKSPR